RPVPDGVFALACGPGSKGNGRTSCETQGPPAGLGRHGVGDHQHARVHDAAVSFHPITTRTIMPFKTALHSVSYAGVWTGQARLSLHDFLRKAKSLGFDGVMLMAKRPHLSVLDYDQKSCAELRRLLRDLSLQVVCLAGYNDLTLGSDRPDIPAREMQTLYVRELARLAQALECSLIRVFT